MLEKLSLMIVIGLGVVGCATLNLNEVGTELVGSSPEELTAKQGQVLSIGATVVLGGETIELEVARTPDQQALGLMFRDRLPDNRGMLFSFQPAQDVAFWMKNVKIPLDLIFLREGMIRSIMTVPPCLSDPCPSYGPAEPIDQVIELRGGRAAELGVKEGDRAIVKFLE